MRSSFRTAAVFLITAFATQTGIVLAGVPPAARQGPDPGLRTPKPSSTPMLSPTPRVAKAVFAGGCFWCMEPPFKALKDRGVISVTSGYTGGDKVNPTYEEVSSGTTGHRESIEVAFDPSRIEYSALLDVFWRNIDPTDASGQFCDKGEQYMSVIYYQDANQKRLADESRARARGWLKVKAPIVTAILPAGKFYPAEEYHQDYARKNPIRYKFYRFSCGRDKRLKEVWGESPH